MRIPAFIYALCLTIASQQAYGREIGGIDIPDSLTLQGSEQMLQLNGAGIRKKFFMDIYVGALYMPSRSSDAQTIINSDGPASIAMHILYSEISTKKIVQGWEDGLRANLNDDELALVRSRLDRFNAMFRDVRKGEVIRITYQAGNETEVHINDDKRGTIEGDDFFRALLKIWLGSSPVSKSLKQAMLGLD